MDNMTMVQKWIDAFVNDNKSKQNIMLIRNYCNQEVTLGELTGALSKEWEIGVYSHAYVKDRFVSPYEPFVDAIADYYYRFLEASMPVDAFLEAAGVYSLHKEILSTYISSQKAHRTEFPIVSEIEYEKGKMIASIASCLNYIATDRNLLLVLDHFQYATASGLSFLNEVLMRELMPSVRLVVVYDTVRTATDGLEDRFDRFIAQVDDVGILYELEDTSEVGHMMSLDLELHSSFYPVQDSFDDYIVRLNNLYYFLALDDMDFYIQTIDMKLKEEALRVSATQLFDFYECASFTYLMKNDRNKAMLMNEQMLGCFDEEKDFELAFRYYHTSGNIQVGLAQVEVCVRYAYRCMELARRLNNDLYLFYSEVLLTAANFSGWRNVFMLEFSKIDTAFEMIERYKQYKFYNTLAHYLVYAFDNDKESIVRIASGEESEYLNMAKALIHKIGNTNLELSLYTKYTVMFSEYGFYKELQQFYDAKLAIFEHEHNDVRRANLYLGMGYNSIVREEYASANDQFWQAIELLCKERRAEEIAEALYNLVENYLCAENYKAARDYMITLLKILENLDLESIKICYVSKLLALMSLSYYMVDNEYRATRYLKQLERVFDTDVKNAKNDDVTFSRENEAIFLYSLLEAMDRTNNGKYREADEFFEKAMASFERSGGMLFYVLVIFIREYAKYYYKVDAPEKAREIIEYGIKYCREQGFPKKEAVLSAFLQGESTQIEKIAARNRKIALKDLVELSYHIGKENLLYEQKKDIQFLSTWQEMLRFNEKDKKTLIQNAMNLLQDNFNLEKVIFTKYMDNNPSILFSNVEIKESDLHAILNFFQMIKREFVVNRVERNFSEYQHLLKFFKDISVFGLMGIPIFDETGLVAVFLAASNVNKNDRTLMKSDDLEILKTAISQLNNSLDRIKDREAIIAINEQLNRLAVMDNLTGLYNRQGFDKMLEQHEECKDTVSVMYVDLDNFKYCNDTFGHDVGDLVLKEFAHLFKKVSRGRGYAVRYGGDEFVIVLLHMNTDEAIEIAKEIYTYIGDGFVDLIERHVGREIEIPKEKKLTCSIGIMSSPNGKAKNIGNALKKADEALYDMKKADKGHYKVWGE